MGILTIGPAVKNHISPKKSKRVDGNISNYVPFVVPGLATSSSSTTPSPTSPSSSSQDSVLDVSRYTENPAPERCGSTSVELRETRCKNPKETANKNKNEDDEELRSELLQDLPDWLQDLKENMVDKSVRPHQDSPSSSHESPMEPRAKVALGPGKHSIFTHLQKDRNCDICLRTKITRASCRRLAGTVVPKAENFGDLITADHKVLSEGCESRHTRKPSRNEQTPNTKIKMKDTKEYKAICCMTCRTGCRNSEKIWSMNVVRQCHGETLSLEIETLPVLLMNYQWTREQKWNRIRAQCPHALSEGSKFATSFSRQK